MRPKRLKIGRKYYSVLYQYLPHDYGRMNPNKNTIRVDETQPPYLEAEILIHEVLHAIWASRGLTPRITEEKAVTALATGLAEVFRDNHGLMAYLESRIKEGR